MVQQFAYTGVNYKRQAKGQSLYFPEKHLCNFLSPTTETTQVQSISRPCGYASSLMNIGLSYVSQKLTRCVTVSMSFFGTSALEWKTKGKLRLANYPRQLGRVQECSYQPVNRPFLENSESWHSRVFRFW